MHDIHLKDYFDLENALVGGGPHPVPAVVSFEVQWNAFGAVNAIDNAALQFRGDFRNAVAKMEFSGRAGDFDFQSAPLVSSTTVAAELGRESNGSFY